MNSRTEDARLPRTAPDWCRALAAALVTHSEICSAAIESLKDAFMGVTELRLVLANGEHEVLECFTLIEAGHVNTEPLVCTQSLSPKEDSACSRCTTSGAVVQIDGNTTDRNNLADWAFLSRSSHISWLLAAPLSSEGPGPLLKLVGAVLAAGKGEEPSIDPEWFRRWSCEMTHTLAHASIQLMEASLDMLHTIFPPKLLEQLLYNAVQSDSVAPADGIMTTIPSCLASISQRAEQAVSTPDMATPAAGSSSTPAYTKVVLRQESTQELGETSPFAALAASGGRDGSQPLLPAPPPAANTRDRPALRHSADSVPPTLPRSAPRSPSHRRSLESMLSSSGGSGGGGSSRTRSPGGGALLDPSLRSPSLESHQSHASLARQASIASSAAAALLRQASLHSDASFLFDDATSLVVMSPHGSEVEGFEDLLQEDAVQHAQRRASHSLDLSSPPAPSHPPPDANPLPAPSPFAADHDSVTSMGYPAPSASQPPTTAPSSPFPSPPITPQDSPDVTPCEGGETRGGQPEAAQKLPPLEVSPCPTAVATAEHSRARLGRDPFFRPLRLSPGGADAHASPPPTAALQLALHVQQGAQQGAGAAGQCDAVSRAVHGSRGGVERPPPPSAAPSPSLRGAAPPSSAPTPPPPTFAQEVQAARGEEFRRFQAGLSGNVPLSSRLESIMEISTSLESSGRLPSGGVASSRGSFPPRDGGEGGALAGDVPEAPRSNPSSAATSGGAPPGELERVAEEVVAGAQVANAGGQSKLQVQEACVRAPSSGTDASAAPAAQMAVIDGRGPGGLAGQGEVQQGVCAVQGSPAFLRSEGSSGTEQSRGGESIRELGLDSRGSDPLAGRGGEQVGEGAEGSGQGGMSGSSPKRGNSGGGDGEGEVQEGVIRRVVGDDGQPGVGTRDCLGAKAPGAAAVGEGPELEKWPEESMGSPEESDAESDAESQHWRQLMSCMRQQQRWDLSFWESGLEGRFRQWVTPRVLQHDRLMGWTYAVITAVTLLGWVWEGWLSATSLRPLQFTGLALILTPGLVAYSPLGASQYWARSRSFWVAALRILAMAVHVVCCTTHEGPALGMAEGVCVATEVGAAGVAGADGGNGAGTAALCLLWQAGVCCMLTIAFRMMLPFGVHLPIHLLSLWMGTAAVGLKGGLTHAVGLPAVLAFQVGLGFMLPTAIVYLHEKRERWMFWKHQHLVSNTLDGQRRAY